MPLNQLKMGNLCFSFSNFSFSWSNILTKRFDHHTQAKFTFVYYVFYGYVHPCHMDIFFHYFVMYTSGY